MLMTLLVGDPMSHGDSQWLWAAWASCASLLHAFLSQSSVQGFYSTIHVQCQRPWSGCFLHWFWWHCWERITCSVSPGWLSVVTATWASLLHFFLSQYSVQSFTYGVDVRYRSIGLPNDAYHFGGRDLVPESFFQRLSVAWASFVFISSFLPLSMVSSVCFLF